MSPVAKWVVCRSCTSGPLLLRPDGTIPDHYCPKEHWWHRRRRCKTSGTFQDYS